MGETGDGSLGRTTRQNSSYRSSQDTLLPRSELGRSCYVRQVLSTVLTCSYNDASLNLAYGWRRLEAVTYGVYDSTARLM